MASSSAQLGPQPSLEGLLTFSARVQRNNVQQQQSQSYLPGAPRHDTAGPAASRSASGPLQSRAKTFTQAGLSASQPLSQQFSQPHSQSDTPHPGALHSPAPGGTPHAPAAMTHPASSRAANALLATLQSGPASSQQGASQQDPPATPTAAADGTLHEVLAAVQRLTEHVLSDKQTVGEEEAAEATGDGGADVRSQLETLTSKVDEVRETTSVLTSACSSACSSGVGAVGWVPGWNL